MNLKKLTIIDLGLEPVELDDICRMLADQARERKADAAKLTDIRDALIAGDYLTYAQADELRRTLFRFLKNTYGPDVAIWPGVLEGVALTLQTQV